MTSMMVTANDGDDDEEDLRMSATRPPTSTDDKNELEGQQGEEQQPSTTACASSLSILTGTVLQDESISYKTKAMGRDGQITMSDNKETTTNGEDGERKEEEGHPVSGDDDAGAFAVREMKGSFDSEEESSQNEESSPPQENGQQQQLSAGNNNDDDRLLPGAFPVHGFGAIESSSNGSTNDEESLVCATPVIMSELVETTADMEARVRSELAASTPMAHAVPYEQGGQRKRFALLFLLIVVVAVGISVGLPLSSKRSTGSGSVVTANAPTPMPSAMPTLRPTNPFWEQLGNDIDGAVANDAWGTSVVVSADGKTLAAGAVGNIPADGTDGLYVRVYKLDDQNEEWLQIGQDLKGSWASDFGRSIGLSADGSIVVVGARSTATESGSRAGSVHVFRFNGSSWVEMGQALFGDISGVWYGWAIALSDDGKIIAVGVPIHTPEVQEGLVRVYRFVGSTWEQLGNDIYGEGVGTQYGNAVSLSSDGMILAGGGHYKGDDTGHVRVYSLVNSTDWVQLGNDIDGEATGDFFGESVALSKDGMIVAIGGPLNDKNTGQARVFRYDGSTSKWQQFGNTVEGDIPGDEFGISVALSGDGSILGVGAWQFATEETLPGYARVFLYADDKWIQLGLDLKGKNPKDHYGKDISLSLDGSIVAIGAPLANIGTGGNDRAAFVSFRGSCKLLVVLSKRKEERKKRKKTTMTTTTPPPPPRHHHHQPTSSGDDPSSPPSSSDH